MSAPWADLSYFLRADGKLDGNKTRHLTLDHPVVQSMIVQDPDWALVKPRFILQRALLQLGPTCLNCRSPINANRRVYCSTKCSNSHQAKIDTTAANNRIRTGYDWSFQQPSNRDKASSRRIRLAAEYREVHWPEAMLNQSALEELAGEHSLQELSEIFDLPYTTVQAYLLKLGIAPVARRSQPELKLAEYIKSLGQKVELNRRSVIPPFELDLWMPEAGVGIEFQGLYYHSEQFKGPSYHVDKLQAAETAGISLYQIWENDWAERPELIQSMIAHRLGLSQRIYARVTKIAQLTRQEAQQFFNRTHLQGDLPRGTAIGLKDATGNLVAALSYGPSRFDKGKYTEIYRYSCELGTSVPGGFTKLLSSLQGLGPTISFANREISSGRLYEAAGFKLIRITRPSYRYYKYIRGSGRVFLSRYQAQKHRIRNILGDIFDETLSEAENMATAGWRRIYDSGQRVYYVCL